MDAVDRQLIQALRENGRASYAELGRLVGLSGPSVTDRINRLEAAGVITGEKLCGVLILTAFSQREIVEQARDAGALAYLVKPFQKSDLIPAIEVAIGRFRELRNLSGEINALGAQLEARKTIDRAKGLLIDECGLKEQDAHTFIQRTAMSERSTMRSVAERILDGSLRPE